jgi:hypothetical protein
MLCLASQGGVKAYDGLHSGFVMKGSGVGWLGTMGVVESRVENRCRDCSLPVVFNEAFAASPQSGLTWFCFLFHRVAGAVARPRRVEPWRVPGFE